MKLPAGKQQSDSAFTLGETMVAMGIASVLCTCALYTLLNGMILFAKNTAENLAHDQNRIAVNRLVHDVHTAVSIPQLGHIVTGNLAANPTASAGSWTPYGTNVTFWADSGTGPAAGIGFKRMGNSADPNGGPFAVSNDPGNVDLIQIASPSHAPQIGTQISFPYYSDTAGHPMEGSVYKVTSAGAGHWNVWVQGGLEKQIKLKKNTMITCYYMSRYAYVVENGKLNLYASTPAPNGLSWPITIARNIINESNRTQAALPFTQASTQYVGISLTTEDNRYSNRNYKAANTLLAASVPIRAQISKSQ
ncbi:MAG: type II secretion system protein J [Chthoniobacterales bacterium]